MVAHHIHHALAQVRDLQQKILEKQRFKGYSGRARALAGTLALVAAAVMGSDRYPADPHAHLAGWSAVFGIAVLLNFGAILYWFLFDPVARRDVRRLRPALDVLPPLAVGAIFTVALVLHGRFQELFGVWMCLYALANFATRHAVPKTIWIPAMLYLVCGAIYLLWPEPSFLNPWPMGIVFFVGEWIGGIILHFDGSEEISLGSFLNIFVNEKVNEHANEI